MSRSRVTENGKGIRALQREMRALTREFRLTIGIHSKDSKPYQKGSDEPATTAQVGSFHEFGTEKIPARPWLTPVFADNRQRYINGIRCQLRLLLDQAITPAQAVGRVGEVIVGDIKERIANGIEPALDEKTIKRKGSSKPLIDTGQLRQSITYQVSKK